ncbi:MAG: hypothetical protein CMJ23_02615 [Phycisphaerae bacterium]|nr:hypothetical protein [Phycisphaerae bacterium]
MPSPEDPRTDAWEQESDTWRDLLLDAVADGRLTARDRREMEHRHDAAPRQARRDAVRGEIEVLQRFLNLGASVRVEVAVPGGRPIDLVVTLGDVVLAVHVKRLVIRTGRTFRPSPAFDALRSVPRPYLVGVAWQAKEPPSPFEIEDMQNFLRSARMGDRHPVRDAKDRLLGSLEVLAPSAKQDPESRSEVDLIGITDPDADERLVERTGRLLRRAYHQFAPGFENVIVLAGGGFDAERLIDRAILGGHVERWDRLPRVGQRVAHGRDDRGLWTGRHYERSQLVAWAPLVRTEGRLWRRDGATPDPRLFAVLESAIIAPPDSSTPPPQRG